MLKAVYWQYLQFQEDLSESDPIYDECGEFCGDKQEPLFSYCEGCPMAAAQKQFEFECIERLDQRSPDQWQKYGFDYLLKTVLDLLKIENLPLHRISAKCGKMISAKNQELIRWKRLEAWNEKTKEKTDQAD